MPNVDPKQVSPLPHCPLVDITSVGVGAAEVVLVEVTNEEGAELEGTDAEVVGDVEPQTPKAALQPASQ